MKATAKKNPYATAKSRRPATASTFQPRKMAIATQVRLPGRDEHLVGHNGEINASDSKDFIRTIASMMSMANSGNHFVTEAQAEEAQAQTKRHMELVKAAFGSTAKHMEVGETVAEELYMAQNREGLMRSFLARGNIADGQMPQVRLRGKNVLAITATGPSSCELQMCRDQYLYPEEYYLEARPYIEMQDIRRSNTDVLEEKYLESLEAFMVQEDRIFFDLVRLSINTPNPLTTVFGSMNPTALGRFRNRVAGWGIPTDFWVIANDLWTDIAGDAGFQQLLDPVTRHDLVLNGELGKILGMTIKSDAFRHPEHKVLAQGEQFIIGRAENLGQYTDRGGIETSPIDQAHTGVPGRGWMMHLTQSQAIANPRACAAGIRQ
jgi:hypothetical protein